LIRNPIAMDMIKKKVKGEEYSSLREFHDDVKLMCDNCKLYNDDSSDIFQSAVDIEVSSPHLHKISYKHN
jgi:ATP-dependent helicase STH1/SNF2